MVNLLVLMALANAAAPEDIYVDQRDGYRYATVLFDGRRWLAENLRFVTPDSRCYANDSANCLEHGRLYRFADAMTACPTGWHIPTEDDWQSLERAIGMAERDIRGVNARSPGHGTRLKVGGDTGFNARFSGWIDPHLNEQSMALGRNAAFWASTETRTDVVWHRDVSAQHEGIWRSPVDTSYWLSLRCVTRQ